MHRQLLMSPDQLAADPNIDVVVIGSGPAGTALAERLYGKSDMRIAVIDRGAIHRGHPEIGARLLLGRIHNPHRVQNLLTMLLRIVNTRHLARDLPGSVRREVHREGVTGAVEVILNVTGHLDTESGH